MIKNEWKSLLRNKLMLIVVIAIIVIPIIYAGLFLKSMWDPYGNVDSLPVAVVNEDKPVEYNGKTLSIGKDMTDELKDNDSMAFNRQGSDSMIPRNHCLVTRLPGYSAPSSHFAFLQFHERISFSSKTLLIRSSPLSDVKSAVISFFPSTIFTQ